MLKHSVRKIISNSLWQELEPAVAAAKHSQAGAPGEMSEREFQRSGAPSPAHREPVAGFATRIGLLACRLHALPALGSARGLAAALAESAKGSLRRGPRLTPGFDHGESASPCGWRVKKKDPSDQALGRSRGGLSTKIHAATLDENCAVAVHLTPGQAHDGRQFESLYESLAPDNVLEAAILDRGYDADRIRERLAYDGITAVIPPLPARSAKPPFNQELYRTRNRVERFFNKLKQFRRLATRYDKLARTFLAALHLVAAFLS